MTRMSNKRKTINCGAGSTSSSSLNGCRRSSHGAGIFQDGVDFITNKFKTFNTALRGRPKVLNDLMNSTSNIKVIGLSVIRQPIAGTFENLLNKFTFGRLKEKMRDLNYDKLFHLYVKFDLENGAFYMIEKNERVVVRTSMPSSTAEFTKVLSINDGKDIKTYIENLESQRPLNQIYVYDSFSTNCQDFVKNLLNTNGITIFDDFIFQDVKQLAPAIIKKISKVGTDAAAVIDVFKRGGEYTGGSIFNQLANAFVQGFTATFKDPITRTVLNFVLPGTGEVANLIAHAVSNNVKGKKYDDIASVFGGGVDGGVVKIKMKDLKKEDVSDLKNEIKDLGLLLPENISIKDLVSISTL